MPYVAIDTKDRRKVDTYDCVQVHEKFPPSEFGGGRLICQFCGAAMHARQGSRYAPHFVHDAECERADYPSKHESPEHFAGKAFVRKIMRESHPKVSVELEVPIAGCTRIADVLVSYRDGWSIAHEIQVSPIAEPELIRRTEDYERAGVDVMWWFCSEPPPVALEWAKRRNLPLIGLKIEDAAPSGEQVHWTRPRPSVVPVRLHPATGRQIDAQRIVKELRYRWYPPRLRLLLTLLLWRGYELTFSRLARGTGLSEHQISGAHGEVAKIVKLTYGETEPERGQRPELTVCLNQTECAGLADWMAGLSGGYGNPAGTVLGRLIELASQDDAPPLVNEAQARASLLKRFEMPSPWPRRKNALQPRAAG